MTEDSNNAVSSSFLLDDDSRLVNDVNNVSNFFFPPIMFLFVFHFIKLLLYLGYFIGFLVEKYLEN